MPRGCSAECTCAGRSTARLSCGAKGTVTVSCRARAHLSAMRVSRTSAASVPERGSTVAAAPTSLDNLRTQHPFRWQQPLLLVPRVRANHAGAAEPAPACVAACSYITLDYLLHRQRFRQEDRVRVRLVLHDHTWDAPTPALYAPLASADHLQHTYAQ